MVRTLAVSCMLSVSERTFNALFAGDVIQKYTPCVVDNLSLCFPMSVRHAIRYFDINY